MVVQVDFAKRNRKETHKEIAKGKKPISREEGKTSSHY